VSAKLRVELIIRASISTPSTRRPDYFAASIKFNMWLSVSSLVSFGSQILLRDAAALSTGAAVGAERPEERLDAVRRRPAAAERLSV